MTTPAVLHMLNNAGQEQEEMASRGVRLATHANTTAVNKGMHRKLWQMLNKAMKTPGEQFFFNPSHIQDVAYST